MKVRLYVVPGKAPLLLGKPMLKSLGAIIDTVRDQLILERLGVTVPWWEAKSGHYQLNLCELINETQKKLSSPEVDVKMEVSETFLAEVAEATSGFR